MRNLSQLKPRGFTLVELMVALAIAGILAAIAYPAYVKQMQKGRRADAIAALTVIMQAQERYRSNVANYASAFADLQMTTASLAQLAPHYQFALSGVGPQAGFSTGFQVTASVVAGSPQASDLTCKTLTVTLLGANPTYAATGDPNNTGTDIDTSSQCWPR
ncbi:MAG: prepilin-type N-terminal cleavage/methylation domain-containing protein [Burkholderiales bacterium]|nr:MAG: prepilin-type N-terminal cleavage/methylation domain-containing protein [Burkholderiales bacterium]